MPKAKSTCWVHTERCRTVFVFVPCVFLWSQLGCSHSSSNDAEEGLVLRLLHLLVFVQLCCVPLPLH